MYNKPKFMRQCAALLRSVVVAGAMLAVPAAIGPQAATPALNGAGGHELVNWLDQDLVPYLAQTLSQHPRFKGEPLHFVSVDGAKIRPDEDDLTGEVIQHLRHALQTIPGINLVWTGDRNAELPCHRTNEPEYEIAIEFVALGHDRYRVAVRALDVREQNWVPGFGRQWRGSLSRPQRAALKRRQGGTRLLGQRSYPYSEAQSDLLARDLARQLARDFCGFVGEPLVVYTQTDEAQPANVNQALELIGNYLTRSREVAVVATADQANVIVSAKIVRIDNDLHQFWVMARAPGRDLALPDVDTQAYITLSQPVRSVAAPAPPVRPVTRSSARAAVRPVNRLRPPDFFSALNVITPRDPRRCRSANPWQIVEGVKSHGNVVATDGCFAIEMRARRDAWIFLVNLDAHAGLVRLLPSSCRTFGRVRTAVARGESVRFPAPGNAIKYSLAGRDRPGSETFHVIAASDRRAAQRINRHVADLRDACNASVKVASHRAQVDRWLRDLRDTVDELGDRAQWRRVEVNYVSRAQLVASRD